MQLTVTTFLSVNGVYRAGRRLFPESGIATGLALDESRTTPSGVTISVYRAAGRLEFGEVEVS